MVSDNVMLTKNLLKLSGSAIDNVQWLCLRYRDYANEGIAVTSSQSYSDVNSHALILHALFRFTLR
jgi:hypothetical protein